MKYGRLSWRQFSSVSINSEDSVSIAENSNVGKCLYARKYTCTTEINAKAASIWQEWLEQNEFRTFILARNDIDAAEASARCRFANIETHSHALSKYHSSFPLRLNALSRELNYRHVQSTHCGKVFGMDRLSLLHSLNLLSIIIELFTLNRFQLSSADAHTSNIGKIVM